MVQEVAQGISVGTYSVCAHTATQEGGGRPMCAAARSPPQLPCLTCHTCPTRLASNLCSEPTHCGRFRNEKREGPGQDLHEGKKQTGNTTNIPANGYSPFVAQ